MTTKQRHQFNRMRQALTKIFKYYQTPAQLLRNCGKDYGLGYQESLEMAYENLQSEAQSAVKGVKEMRPPKPKEPKRAKVMAPIITIALMLSAIFSYGQAGNKKYFDRCRDSLVKGFCLVHCAIQDHAEMDVLNPILDVYDYYRSECLKMLPNKLKADFLSSIVHSLDSCKCKN